MIPDSRTTSSCRLFIAAGKELVCEDLDQSLGATRRGVRELPQEAQFASFSPTCDLLYVACSNGGIGRRGNQHSLSAVRIQDPDDLKIEGSIALPYRPIHVAMDRAGNRLHVAFNLPAAYMAVMLNGDGSIGQAERYSEDAAVVGTFPHQVLPLPEGDEVILTCRGDDPTGGEPEHPGSLRILRPSHLGKMECIQAVAPGSGFGFGPRNCAFHPSLPVLYAVLERQNAFAMFGRSGHELAEEPAAMLSTLLPDGPAPVAQLAGDLCVHPGGRTAYVLNRANLSVNASGENSVAVFGLDERTGVPRYETSIRLPGQRPRTVAITSRGDRLAVTAMGHGASEPATVCLFAIDPDGLPRLEAQTAVEWADTAVMWAAFQGSN